MRASSRHRLRAKVRACACWSCSTLPARFGGETRIFDDAHEALRKHFLGKCLSGAAVIRSNENGIRVFPIATLNDNSKHWHGSTPRFGDGGAHRLEYFALAFVAHA